MWGHLVDVRQPVSYRIRFTACRSFMANKNFLAMIIVIYYIFVYYILFFQFPLLMLIPPSPVSFYGNTILSVVDFYITVSSWMKYLFHCQNCWIKRCSGFYWLSSDWIKLYQSSSKITILVNVPSDLHQDGLASLLWKHLLEIWMCCLVLHPARQWRGSHSLLKSSNLVCALPQAWGFSDDDSAC